MFISVHVWDHRAYGAEPTVRCVVYILILSYGAVASCTFILSLQRHGRKNPTRTELDPDSEPQGERRRAHILGRCGLRPCRRQLHGV